MRTIILSLFIMLNLGYACETPVFRYALERWTPSPYQIYVVHKKTLSDKQKNAVALLQQFGRESRAFNTNIIDRSKSKTVVDGLKPLKFDVEIQVMYPLDAKESVTFWQVPLTTANVKQIVDSPARQKIVEKITSGSPSAWLFVAGNSDSASQLKLLKKLLIDEQNRNSVPQLLDSLGNAKHEFYPIIEISHNDPKEQFFIAMLQSVDNVSFKPDSSNAILFYGQGRALTPINQNNFTPAVIKDQCSFILGNCSCIVKGQNPGVDMLFKADWSKNLGETWIEDEEQPAVTSSLGFLEVIELPPITDDVVEEPEEITEIIDETSTDFAEEPPSLTAILIALCALGITGTLIINRMKK